MAEAAEKEKHSLTMCIGSVDFTSNDADEAIKNCTAHSIIALRKFGNAAPGLSAHTPKHGGSTKGSDGGSGESSS